MSGASPKAREEKAGVFSRIHAAQVRESPTPPAMTLREVVLTLLISGPTRVTRCPIASTMPTARIWSLDEHTVDEMMPRPLVMLGVAVIEQMRLSTEEQAIGVRRGCAPSVGPSRNFGINARLERSS